MEVELCKNGHVRTEENTSWVKRGDRPGLRRRCLDCQKPNRTGQTRAEVHEKARNIKRQLTTDLHENVEDLLSFGATHDEIIERSGFYDWPTMHKSLKRRERYDLIEAIQAKRPPSTRISSACAVEDCTNKHYAIGFCKKHWQRNKAHGSPTIVLKPGRKLKREKV